jgi:spermidine synthase
MKKPRWFDEVLNEQSRFGLRVKESIFSGRSELQQIDLLETASFGRVLAIDEIFMTSERDEHYYHEMLVHPPLTVVPRLDRVLVIGGGDGGTVREVLSYPEVGGVTMVEIDPKVVEICQEHLRSIGRAWDDPRLELIIGDGIDYAINADVAPYDVVLLDGSDPVGPAEGLFTADFYRGVARLTAEGGVFALQSESPVLQRDTFLQIGRTLGGIFERVHPYFGPVPIYASGSWSWTFCSNSVDNLAFKEERVALQEARCKYYNREIHCAAFALPNDLKSIFKNGKDF